MGKLTEKHPLGWENNMRMNLAGTKGYEVGR
jgi:hypothetical protein